MKQEWFKSECFKSSCHRQYADRQDKYSEARLYAVQKYKGFIADSERRFWMKRIICLLLIITCVIISGCSLPFADRKFSTEKWIQAEDGQKYHYIKDLEENYNLIGMTSQEVRELLGEPYDEKVKGQVGFEEYSTHDDRTDMIFYYRLREDIISGWEIYLIRFKNNVVFETETGVEDW